MLTSPSANRRKKQEDENDDDEGGEDDEEEEEEEDEEEEESAGPSQPEMSRTERKALKKQQGTRQKGKGNIDPIKEAGSGEESQDDSDLINPNRAPIKNLSISDVGAPRELSRRERCVSLTLRILVLPCRTV